MVAAGGGTNWTCRYPGWPSTLRAWVLPALSAALEIMS